MNATSSKRSAAKRRPILRQHLVDRHFEIGVSIANALAKLYSRLSPAEHDSNGKIQGEFALMAVSIGRFLTSQYISSEAVKIDAEAYDRIIFDIQVLCSSAGQSLVKKALDSDAVSKPCVVKSTISLGSISANSTAATAKSRSQADSPIVFRLLKSTTASAKRGMETQDEIEASLSAALSLPSSNRLTSNLSKITQFTGYSDSVYAEAYVTVSQFDIG